MGPLGFGNTSRRCFPVLDYYHCKEYLHTVAKVQYASSERALEWVEATLTRLYLGKVGWGLGGLRRMPPPLKKRSKRLTIAECISRTIGIGPTMGSCVEEAIPLAVVGSNRRTNACVMCGSSALGHGGTSATAMRCWHCAAPSITIPSIGCLNAIDSDFERRKNHRMLLAS
jgi:hypothetical protein